jgi:hypothetical protein
MVDVYFSSRFEIISADLNLIDFVRDKGGPRPEKPRNVLNIFFQTVSSLTTSHRHCYKISKFFAHVRNFWRVVFVLCPHLRSM